MPVIRFKQLNGSIIELDVDLSASIGDVKQILEEQHAFTAHSLIFLFNRAQLEDNQTIESLNLQEGQFISLIKRNRPPKNPSHQPEAPPSAVIPEKLEWNSPFKVPGSATLKASRELLRRRIEDCAPTFDHLIEIIEAKRPDLGKKIRDDPRFFMLLLGITEHDIGKHDPEIRNAYDQFSTEIDDFDADDTDA